MTVRISIQVKSQTKKLGPMIYITVVIKYHLIRCVKVYIVKQKVLRVRIKYSMEKLILTILMKLLMKALKALTTQIGILIYFKLNLVSNRRNFLNFLWYVVRQSLNLIGKSKIRLMRNLKVSSKMRKTKKNAKEL